MFPVTCWKKRGSVGREKKLFYKKIIFLSHHVNNCKASELWPTSQSGRQLSRQISWKRAPFWKMWNKIWMVRTKGSLRVDAPPQGIEDFWKINPRMTPFGAQFSHEIIHNTPVQFWFLVFLVLDIKIHTYIFGMRLNLTYGHAPWIGVY